MRLERYLHDCGVGSRKEIKKIIRAGRVQIDGKRVDSGAATLLPGTEVRLDGELLAPPQGCHLMLHKPAGVVTALRDAHDPTVWELLPPEVQRQKPMPVGRLDKDTTGLLLFIDDGELAHRLTHPNRRVAKTYRVGYDNTLPDDAESRLEGGINLHDGITLPARLERIGADEARLTICEGRFHQVKRMFAALGCPVHRLHREAVGDVLLDDELGAGEWRLLTKNEVAALRRAVAMDMEEERS